MSGPTKARSPRPRLSEDWIATLVGLALVLVIGLGAVGPGPQSGKVSAAPGETEVLLVEADGGWSTTAKLGDTAAQVAGAYTRLEAGGSYVVVCENDTLAAQPDAALPEGVKAAPQDRAQLVLVNQCADKASLTLKTDFAIPWPIFKWFK